MSQLELIQKLRKMTGVGIMDCKQALLETDNNLDAAVDYLREKGKATAAKKASRDASEGLIFSYIHPGSKLGVLLEVNCETDFVAKTDEFQEFVREVAMQIAAADPRWISSDDVSEEDINKEKDIIRRQLIEEGKPENIIDRIIEGKINRFYSDYCLLNQAYIRDDKKTIDELLKELIAKLGENMKIARFARFEIGK